MTEDEELALALAMSVEGNEPAASSGAGPAQSLPESAEPSAGGQQDADAMPGVSKQENTFAAANGAAQVGSITWLLTVYQVITKCGAICKIRYVSPAANAQPGHWALA